MKAQCSILVCTRNRAEILGETMDLLGRCLESGDGIEVIVVDNASTDATRSVVGLYGWARYVHEPRTGLSHARNTAVRAAGCERIIFIDDDVLMSRAWLHAYRRFFKKAAPEVVFWGGRSKRISRCVCLPDWRLGRGTCPQHGRWSIHPTSPISTGSTVSCLSGQISAACAVLSWIRLSVPNWAVKVRC